MPDVSVDAGPRRSSAARPSLPTATTAAQIAATTAVTVARTVATDGTQEIQDVWEWSQLWITPTVLKER